jgi:hypothetical protein
MPDTLAHDYLEGVSAIAAFLGWSERKVYHVRERGGSCPIRKREGVGIYAFKSELITWLKCEETLSRPAA